MNVGEAIDGAKKVILALFGNEGIDDLNLEEVAFHEKKAEWRVVISFARSPAQSPKGALGGAFASLRRRDKKLVRLRPNGDLIAVTEMIGYLSLEIA